MDCDRSAKMGWFQDDQGVLLTVRRVFGAEGGNTKVPRRHVTLDRPGGAPGRSPPLELSLITHY